MTDQEILEAMRQMLEGLEDKMDKKLEIQKQELLNGVKVLMENTVQTQINLVGEDVQIIRERMPNADDLETMETRLSAVEVVVKKHSKDIQDLKKAQ